MPHLCDKMRRLTTKDLSKKKKMEDGPTPDFYALSRENPLPESTPVPTSTLTPAAMAGGRTGTDLASADVELALLERRRADIFNRMNLMNNMNGMQQQMQQMQQGGFGQVGPTGQMGQQDGGGMQQQMNNPGLMAAAALSLGNNGRPNTINPSALQQQMLGGMGNMGNVFDPQNAALQRQLLGARLANSDMAAILGLNNGNMQMQNNGMNMNGMSGFMGNMGMQNPH